MISLTAPGLVLCMFASTILTLLVLMAVAFFLTSTRLRLLVIPEHCERLEIDDIGTFIKASTLVPREIAPPASPVIAGPCDACMTAASEYFAEKYPEPCAICREVIETYHARPRPTICPECKPKFGPLGCGW